ncbi:acyl--CoA ligase [Undibacterium jejuense]|uniref:Acyl--CoA ligase n=1 Tax=Undibacterium jejuense TaxID=1344949 RepID=A0A923KQT4_9BURK|nr:class I adenylate-forming enzyme family protein [Undibacterium jejuense]MBC3864178.1 acyl--CoA ligase [Undibacterium jejuense]
MRNLAERFATFNANEIAWYGANDFFIDATKLSKVFGQISPEAWKGKRVAISDMSVIELVASMVFLDGIAETILLLPSEDNSEIHTERLVQAKIDIVLNEDGIGFLKILHGKSPDIAVSPRQWPSSDYLDDPISTTWLLPTSGTTGIPKLIPHTFQSLTRSMVSRNVSAKFVWGSLYSLRRFAGLQVFLQSWLCGTPLILNDDSDSLDTKLTRFAELGCNALSATPSMWRKLAMHPMFDQLKLTQITLGGEIVDQTVLDLLSRKFPSSRITHIYASTEAGVGFVVRDNKAGFPLTFLNSSISGVELRVDELGHLWLRSQRDNQAAWIDSGDMVDVRKERVYFLGRANGSINVGGNKVMPEEVELVIQELSEVAFVQVRARKSAMLGSLVEAAITPSPGISFDASIKKKIIDHCRERLEGFKVPAFVVVADSIALSASGKLLRGNLE